MNLSDLTILSSKEHLALQSHVRGLRRATGTRRWHLVPILRARWRIRALSHRRTYPNI